MLNTILARAISWKIPDNHAVKFVIKQKGWNIHFVQTVSLQLLCINPYKEVDFDNTDVTCNYTDAISMDSLLMVSTICLSGAITISKEQNLCLKTKQFCLFFFILGASKSPDHILDHWYLKIIVHANRHMWFTLLIFRTAVVFVHMPVKKKTKKLSWVNWLQGDSCIWQQKFVYRYAGFCVCESSTSVKYEWFSVT